MKVSIITVCLNSEKSILQTINSVNEQTHKDIEHIFIDGRSTDDTVQIIRNTSKKNPKIFYQIKTGIYNAMNIGLKNCTGEIILFLNSDDFIANRFVVAQVVKNFDNKHDILFGNIKYFNPKNKQLSRRKFKPSVYYKYAYKNGWHAPHPAFFIKRKSIIEQFNESSKISADFEFMFKHQEVFNLKSKYLPIDCIIMSNGGASQKLLNIIKGNIELIKVIKYEYPDLNIIYFIFKRFFFKLRSSF